MEIRGRAVVVAVVLSITLLFPGMPAGASAAHTDRTRDADATAAWKHPGGLHRFHARIVSGMHAHRQVIALDRDSMHRAARRVRSRRGAFRFAATWSHRIDGWERSRTRQCRVVERASRDCIRVLAAFAERREWLHVEISWLASRWWTELDPACTAPESVRICSPMRFVLDHADREYVRLTCVADHERIRARASAAEALRIARAQFIVGEQTDRLMEYLAAPDGGALAALAPPDTHCTEVDPVDEPVTSSAALLVEHSSVVAPELAVEGGPVQLSDHRTCVAARHSTACSEPRHSPRAQLRNLVHMVDLVR